MVQTTKEILWPGNKRDTDCFVLSVGKKYKSLGQYRPRALYFSAQMHKTVSIP